MSIRKNKDHDLEKFRKRLFEDFDNRLKKCHELREYENYNVKCELVMHKERALELLEGSRDHIYDQVLEIAWHVQKISEILIEDRRQRIIDLYRRRGMELATREDLTDTNERITYAWASINRIRVKQGYSSFFLTKWQSEYERVYEKDIYRHAWNSNYGFIFNERD